MDKVYDYEGLRLLNKIKELLELEDVQGVVGLKAIRVEVLYHKDEDASEEKALTYEDLMEVLH